MEFPLDISHESGRLDKDSRDNEETRAMEFLGNTWWIWLISGFGAVLVGVILHVVNIRLMHRGMAEAMRRNRSRSCSAFGVPSIKPMSPELPCGAFTRFFKRFGFAMFFFFIASICEVLFVVGVIVRIIEVFKDGAGA